MSELNITNPVAGYQAVKLDKPIDATTQFAMQFTRQVIDGVDKLAKATWSENNTELPELTAAEISATVEEMNTFLKDMKRNLSFSVDDDLGKSVITVKDSESDEIIRQIPSEELVVLRKKMDDVAGILFDTKV
ncbi:flagellar protein FlaG [uncultured Psychromonas sp.]|uniref:flagellar protein FlaG n=1 Tax=uncultured Psychromonas sp. TaxID=173974 RepID=UPI00263566B6|nr:flagellar protein FlaG [uncultured Psychromonas sp.]